MKFGVIRLKSLFERNTKYKCQFPATKAIPPNSNNYCHQSSCQFMALGVHLNCNKQENIINSKAVSMAKTILEKLFAESFM